MDFLEKDLEDILFETDNLTLQNRGLPIYGLKKRQVKIGNYGIADLICFERMCLEEGGCIRLTVYELKRDKVGVDAFMQLIGYMQGLTDYFKSRNTGLRVLVYGVLIGKGVERVGNFCYLNNFFDKLEVFKYTYGVDGINFIDEYGYSLTDKGW